IPAGLPPKSLSNSGQRGLTGRLRSRSQADQDQERLASHRGYRFGYSAQSCVDTFAAIAVVQLKIHWLTLRIRGQARSHRGL
ncbi:hypothetical protein, partial [Pseudomonas lactis]|uniref:hypothetical protein n=1 Tax=Pseudomonas lactis TaxID=1615674 RepID=UPI001F24CAE0